MWFGVLWGVSTDHTNFIYLLFQLTPLVLAIPTILLKFSIEAQNIGRKNDFVARKYESIPPTPPRLNFRTFSSISCLAIPITQQ